MNKKGQALVEFVIILPIFIFMLLTMIDIGKIIYYKNDLENELNTAISLYQEKKSYDEIKEAITLNEKDLLLEVNNDNNTYVTFTVKKPVDIVTPGLNFIFPTPYEVTVKRVMYYE